MRYHSYARRHPNSYELSGLLESAAAVNAAKGLSAEVHGKLAALVGRMREAVRAGGAFEEHASLGTEFHETILSLSDNPLIRSLASRSSRVISKFLMYERWRTLYTPEELYDRHNRIYEALCSGERRRIEMPCANTMPNRRNGLPGIAFRLTTNPAERGRPISRKNRAHRVIFTLRREACFYENARPFLSTGSCCQTMLTALRGTCAFAPS